MKKILSIILISLTFSQYISTKTYANCDMSCINEEQIDVTKLNKKGTQIFTQTIDNKKVTITRYEQFSKTNLYLEKEIYDAVKELIQKKNSKIDLNVFIHVLDRAMDLLCKTTNAEANALSQITKTIDTQTLNKITEDEQKKAAMRGRDSAVIPSAGATALGTTLGILCKSGFVKVMEGETAKTLLTKVGLSASGTFASIVPLAAGFTVGGLVLYGCGELYNRFYIIPLTEKLQNLLLVRQHIYAIIKDDVINHRWIDGNILITAAPIDTSCTKGYSSFHHIDGVRYNKSQKVINWEFAKSECKFLNADHDDCYQKAKETIECLIQNRDDPSKCKNNPYYHSERYALEL